MSGAVRQRLMSALARRAGLRVFRLFSRRLEPNDSAAAAGPLRLRMVGEPEAGVLCADPELDLAASKVGAAYARGDLCVGAFDAGRLAGYCWLAFSPLPHLDGVWVEFHPQAAWTYKSFVRPADRGRGAAAGLYRFADRACAERGRRFSIICVESHNQRSISAALHAGYERAGWAAYLRRGSRLLTWCSPAARHCAVRFFDPGQ